MQANLNRDVYRLTCVGRTPRLSPSLAAMGYMRAAAALLETISADKRSILKGKHHIRPGILNNAESCHPGLATWLEHRPCNTDKCFFRTKVSCAKEQVD